MKKFLSILIGLLIVVFTSSLAQPSSYSLNMDSIQQGKIVNVKVSNSPNITLSDKSLIDNLAIYRVDQLRLLDQVNTLSLKLNSIPSITSKELVVKNKGFTDEQIHKSIKLNTILFISSFVLILILYLYNIKPTLNITGPFTSSNRAILFSIMTILYLLIWYGCYYLSTVIFNSTYFQLKDTLNLFG